MGDTPLSAPTDGLVAGINKALDFILEGLGADAALMALIAAAPWTGSPWAKWFFKLLVDNAAKTLDTAAQRNIDKLVIRFQDHEKKVDYDKQISTFKAVTANPGATDAEKQKALADARAAIDALVNRNK